jgi:hypothetical protein
MSAPSPDEHLLQRLAGASGDPDPDDCELLAARLMALGATADAARWRSWGLLAPAAEHLQAGLEQAWRLLIGGTQPDAAPVHPPGWVLLERRLEEGAAAAELEQLVRQLEPHPGDSALELRLSLSQRLLQAGAARAALVALDPLMPAARVQPLLANQLAEVQRRCGNAVQAELWTRLSLRVQPQQPLVWFQLARMLLDQAAPDDALSCAEAGLLHAPGHRWGLKLRANALVANGGWHSYDRLQEAGVLSDDAEFRACLEVERARYRRRGCLGLRRPGLPGLEERLRLRSLLRLGQGPVVLVQGRSGEVLRWLLEAGVWSEPPPVAPHASRDPLRVQEELGAAGFAVQVEQPLSQLLELETIGLLVIGRAAGRRLPLLLAEPLRRAQLVLAPVGLLQLAGQPLLRCGGWVLVEGEASRDG